MTGYTVGLGSCGSTHSDSELVAAMDHGQMANGDNPNENSNCGRSVKIRGTVLVNCGCNLELIYRIGPKGSVTVKIVDTCPSCAYGNIDLSPSAFKRIANLDDGIAEIKWSW